MQPNDTRRNLLCLLVHALAETDLWTWTWSKSFRLFRMTGWHLHISLYFAAEVEVEVLGGSEVEKKETNKKFAVCRLFTSGMLRNDTK